MAGAGLCFAFIMPSAMGRVMLLVPITLALADHFGFAKGSNGRTGLVLAAVLGTYMPAFSILPANAPNIILAGLAERQLGRPLFFFDYLLRHFPVLGLTKTILIVLVIAKFYPDRLLTGRGAGGKAASAMPPDQRVTAGIILCMMLLWMTDFYHHISPAWVALGGAVCLFFPGIGPLGKEAFDTKINFGSLFFVAGVIGIGNLIQHSGIGSLIGRYVIALLPLQPETPFLNYILISLASSLTGLFTTLPGVPAVITPLIPDIVRATGLSADTALMIQVVGFSTLLFPYQASPLVVAMHVYGKPSGSILAPVLVIAALTCLVLMPLNYLWWCLAGIM